MATVFFPDHLLAYSDDQRQVEVQASTYRELVRLLDNRFPGIEPILSERISVAIDGHICHEPFLERIEANSEVHFLHPIAAG
jgi:hypothetical protein